MGTAAPRRHRRRLPPRPRRDDPGSDRNPSSRRVGHHHRRNRGSLTVASGSFTSVNLSQLPAPAVIEVLDFEAMFDESLTALQALDPAFDALLPSDPAFKILEVCTYLRLLDRH